MSGVPRRVLAATEFGSRFGVGHSVRCAPMRVVAATGVWLTVVFGIRHCMGAKACGSGTVQCIVMMDCCVYVDHGMGGGRGRCG